MSESTASQLAQLLDDYLFSLWSTYGIKLTYRRELNFFSGFACGSDESIYEIPWEKVIKDPHQYFDTSVYKLPYVNAPDVLKFKPLHIFALHDFFLSTSPPFQFRSKDAGTKRLISGGEDEPDVDHAASRVSPEPASKEHPKNTGSVEATHRSDIQAESHTPTGTSGQAADLKHTEKL